MAMQKYASWWDSLKNFLTKFQQPTIPSKAPRAPAPVTTTAPQEIPSDAKKMVILKAAQTHTLALMKYNGVYRYIEPYSYRFKGSGELLFAYCHKDHHIESFKLEKAEDIQNTEIPFEPRWPVEVGASR